MFRHLLLPFVFFPAVIFSIVYAQHWPAIYAGSSVIVYIVLDRISLRSSLSVSNTLSWFNSCFLLFQIPLSIILLILLFASVSPETLGAEFIQRNFALELIGFNRGVEAIAAAIVVGFHLSTNFVVAHELMHRPNKLLKGCSRFLLIMVGDAQFQEAHIYGHHANVGTMKDPATSRRGENFYSFFIRSSIGQWKEAYNYECRRLSKKSQLNTPLKNRVVRGNFLSCLLFILTVIYFGWFAMVCYVLVAFIAKFLLEAINYIQHYGLVRQKGVRSDLTHSWESDGLGSSLILFNLTRHAQHHQRPLITCNSLEYSAESPQIKGGYMLTIMLCFIPKLWFHIIHPMLDVYELKKNKSENLKKIKT